MGGACPLQQEECTRAEGLNRDIANNSAENRLCPWAPPMHKRRLIAGDPMPLSLPGPAVSLGLIPLEIPHARDIMVPKMLYQPFTQAA